MKPLTHKKKSQLIFYTLALLYLVFFWRKLLLSDMVPFFGDTPFMFLPTWMVGKKLLTQGFYFLWDPFRNMGQPFLAFPTNQAIYPLRFFSYFTDYVGYQKIFVVSHTILASSFAYLVAKEWFKDESASWFAAVGFGFNGFFFWRVIYQSDFATMAWVPVILFFFIKRKPILLGCSLLMQGLAGFPAFFLMTVVFLGVLVFVDEKPHQKFYCLLKALVIGAGLGAIQWIPFLEMFKESSRPLLYGSGKEIEMSLPLVDLFSGFFVPSFSPYFGYGMDFGLWNFYLGPIVTVLAALGFIKGGKREKVITILGVFCLIIAIGEHSKLFVLIPGLTIVRYPCLFLFLTTICFILVATKGTTFIKNRIAKGILIGLIAFDFGVYSIKWRFGWADQTFAMETPVRLPGLNEIDGFHRLYHPLNIVDQNHLWGSWSQEDWLFQKGLLNPSYGLLFGVRETLSRGSLINRRVYEYVQRIGFSNPNPLLLNYADIGKYIQLSSAGALKRPPAWKDFKVVNNPSPFGRAFLVGGTGSLELLKDVPGEVLLRSTGSGLLVFSEAYFPGWNVEVNGKKRKIEIFENTFPSVHLEDGHHQIRFFYKPFSVIIGTLVSLFTVLTILIVHLAKKYRKRITRPRKNS